MSIGIGDALREARESQGRTQADAAQSLRVRTDYVEALETEQFDVFGADTYARGHLRNYATWLGVDPTEVLALYDRYVRRDDQTAHHIADAPVSLQARDPLPQWMVVLGAAVAVLVAVALVGMLGDRTPDPADVSIADETSPTPSPTATDGDSEPPAAPTGGPPPSPTFDGVEMLLVFEGRSWMQIMVDGQPHPRSGSTIEAGETLELQASDAVEIRYGNAGAVLVEVNGTDYGRAGGNGEVIDVTYGPDGPVTDDAQA